MARLRACGLTPTFTCNGLKWEGSRRERHPQLLCQLPRSLGRPSCSTSPNDGTRNTNRYHDGVQETRAQRRGIDPSRTTGSRSNSHTVQPGMALREDSRPRRTTRSAGRAARAPQLNILDLHLVTRTVPHGDCDPRERVWFGPRQCAGIDCKRHRAIAARQLLGARSRDARHARSSCTAAYDR